MKNSIKNIHDLGKLFAEVQQQNIFPDNKTFPDCIPKKALDEIKENYENASKTNNFDLKSFVFEHFELPKEEQISYESNKNASAKEHIEELWDVLTRESKEENTSLIALPKPYVVPGGRFREVYYWDSYFTMLGLQVSRRIDLIENIIDNFAFLLDKVGHIPNANRTYYVGRSQPPFFALMVRLLADEKGDEILLKYLPQLQTEYDFWMNGKATLSAKKQTNKRVVKLADGEILNRFYDKNATPRPESFKEDVELSHLSTQKPTKLFRNLRAAAESGWDFSSRWLREPNAFESIHTTDIIAVDLNCLLWFLEQLLSEAYFLKNDTKNVEKYEKLAKNRKKTIEKYCWNEAKGFYFDYDFVAKKQKEVESLAACFPLFFEISDAKKTKKVADILENKFLKTGGLLTTLHFTGQQWDAPNGWSPLQWIAYKGLKNYKQDLLAEKIRTNWVNLNLKVYEKTGKMTEKYNVFDQNTGAGGGEYPNQDGFGWTNGVLLRMLS